MKVTVSLPNKSDLAFFEGVRQWKLSFGTKWWWKASGNNRKIRK